MSAETPALADYVSAEMTDTQAVDSILAAVKKRAFPVDLLRPLIYEWIITRRRCDVRDAERAARRPMAPFTGPNADELNAQRADGPDWRRLLHLTFTVARGGKTVTWGEATIVEHRERAEYLEAQARATVATASQHRTAIETCEAAGVDCLAFLPDLAPTPTVASTAREVAASERPLSPTPNLEPSSNRPAASGKKSKVAA